MCGSDGHGGNVMSGLMVVLLMTDVVMWLLYDDDGVVDVGV